MLKPSLWAPNAAKEKPRYFPRRYAIKVMGRADADFQSVVLAIMRRYAPDLDETAISARVSSGGKWLAVTVTFVAQNRAQLNAIYRDLSAHEQVVWAL
ncbi:DUF493 domain-containing protein [uncultured Thiodictyon sp.]|uniref:YbeD family protein n=1 Tax=uncultured Thiodictyon sp. TaxID=1846217 RepID=UPI0025FC4807|nr:DUF493 domain-containing protein [uncultured Thiodictyon sp.]